MGRYKQPQECESRLGFLEAGWLPYSFIGEKEMVVIDNKVFS
jgi:hypothetical protein